MQSPTQSPQRGPVRPRVWAWWRLPKDIYVHGITCRYYLPLKPVHDHRPGRGGSGMGSDPGHVVHGPPPTAPRRNDGEIISSRITARSGQTGAQIQVTLFIAADTPFTW